MRHQTARSEPVAVGTGLPVHYTVFQFVSRAFSAFALPYDTLAIYFCHLPLLFADVILGNSKSCGDFRNVSISFFCVVRIIKRIIFEHCRFSAVH